jgi:C-terminal processing protease CtpA/Prc
MKAKRRNLVTNLSVRWIGISAVWFLLLVVPVPAQDKHAKEARKLGIEMLRDIKSTLKENYYDSTFRGVNLDERFRVAEARVNTLDSYPQVFRAIAQVLIEFNDSHTNFFPPRLTKTVDYGFTWQMIGDRCYVVDVKKGSDAEAKGLKVGDLLTGVENYNPTRENLWLMTYLWWRLAPRESLRVFVASPDGTERELLITSKFVDTDDFIEERRKLNAKPYRCEELTSDLITCKLYTFSVEPPLIDDMMKLITKYKKLILDLRGNGGGHVATEIHLTGYFFDHDVKIGNLKTRKKPEERMARSHKKKAFTGDLIVLIDSKTMSAAEVFARVIQLEKRGKIIGDVSAGKVMTSKYMPLYASTANAGFGLNVTIGDLIMSDGQSLEGVGVIPDKAIGPTAEALVKGTDPVLAYAAKMFGVLLTPEQAGALSFLKSRY